MCYSSVQWNPEYSSQWLADRHSLMFIMEVTRTIEFVFCYLSSSYVFSLSPVWRKQTVDVCARDNRILWWKMGSGMIFALQKVWAGANTRHGLHYEGRHKQLSPVQWESSGWEGWFYCRRRCKIQTIPEKLWVQIWHNWEMRKENPGKSPCKAQGFIGKMVPGCGLQRDLIRTTR